MKNHLIITVIASLKTPCISWSFKNAQGGSFSNSGMHRSLKACAKHAYAMLQGTENLPDLPVYIRTVEGFDEQGNSVATEICSHLFKLLDPKDRR